MTVRASTSAIGIAICGLIALWSGLAVAQTPLPEKQDRRIYDQAGVLAPSTEAALERRHAELYAETGVGIVVITLPKLEGEEIADYAVRAGHQWGVGKEDRGVMVVVSLDPRKVFVATGYGVEGILPDGLIFDLKQKVQPTFAQNDFSTGIVQLTGAISAIAAKAYDVKLDGQISGRAERPGANSSCRGAGGILFLVLFGVFGLIGLLGKRRGYGRHRGGGGGDIATSAIVGLAIGSLLGRSSGFGGGGFGGGGGGGFDGFGGGDFGGGGGGFDF